MKLKHIHSRNVRKQLEDRGNEQIGEEKNKKYPKFFIYLFEETPKLLNDLTDITNNQKK